MWKKRKRKNKDKDYDFTTEIEKVRVSRNKNELLKLKIELESEIEYFKNISLVGIAITLSAAVIAQLIGVVSQLWAKLIMVLLFSFVAVRSLNIIGKGIIRTRSVIELKNRIDLRIKSLEEIEKKRIERLPPRRR